MSGKSLELVCYFSQGDNSLFFQWPYVLKYVLVPYVTPKSLLFRSCVLTVAGLVIVRLCGNNFSTGSPTFYTTRRFTDVNLSIMIMKLFLKEQSDLCIEKMVITI